MWVKVCSKQKRDVTNDVTSDPAAMRCMSDIVFAAESNQVCRKEGRGAGGEQGHAFRKPPPLPFTRRPAAPRSVRPVALMIKMAASFFLKFFCSGHTGIPFTCRYQTITEAEHKHTHKHRPRPTLSHVPWFYSCHINSEALSPARPWSD